MDVTLERLDETDEHGIIVETPDFTLARPEFVIGRAEDCHLQLASRFVSRHHCELIVDDRDHLVRIRDLGSQNGTYVNEALVDECELKDGDRVRVACIPFEVHIGSE
jgi:pSer/pThr/pTyr-binding forkhead associated (FHA) protein